MQETKVYYPQNIDEWRKWLAENHLSQESVWLVYYSKSSQKPSITWSQAVDVALCFGWIDSKRVKIDHETSHQFFSKRRAKSTWSKINKNKVEQLIAQGLFSEAGFASVAIAKQNGSWTFLDEVEDLIIPEDLEAAFITNKETKESFLALSKSKRKLILYHIISAKRPETRKARVEETIQSLKTT